jgi:hypothetical protein
MKKFYYLINLVFIAGFFNLTYPQDSTFNLPSQFVQLKQNFPNPFNPTTQIEYYLSHRTYVEINIYNVLGVRLVSFAGLEQEKGWYKIEFNAEDLPAGLYIYELQTPMFKQIRKMLYMK